MGCAMRNIVIWLKAARIQLHTLGTLPVLVGSLAASSETGDFSPIRFILAEAIVLFVLIATAFANDCADVETDRINKNFNIFSGGSGAITGGLISRQEMLNATKIASLAAVATSVLSSAFFRMHSSTIVMTLIGLFIGIEYSLPPLKINWRGSGESFVMVMYSVFCVYFGYLSQRGALFSLKILSLSVPLAITAFLAILITEIPDCESDALSGKKTIPAVFGKETAFLVYIMGIIALYLTVLILHLFGAISGGALSGIMFSSPLGVSAIVLSLRKDRDTLKNLFMLCGLTMTLCVWTGAALSVNLALGR